MAKCSVCGRLNLRLECLTSLVSPDQPEHLAHAAMLDLIQGQMQVGATETPRDGWTGHCAGRNRQASEMRRGFAAYFGEVTARYH